MQHIGSSQLGQSLRWRNGRFRSPAKAYQRAIASLPREGRIQRQVRRAFVANTRPTMKQLREWCYPRQARQHWHHTNIYRALRRLGAKRIGWGMYAASVDSWYWPLTY